VAQRSKLRGVHTQRRVPGGRGRRCLVTGCHRRS
jgi:hypothetical protein